MGRGSSKCWAEREPRTGPEAKALPKQLRAQCEAACAWWYVRLYL